MGNPLQPRRTLCRSNGSTIPKGREQVELYRSRTKSHREHRLPDAVSVLATNSFSIHVLEATREWVLETKPCVHFVRPQLHRLVPPSLRRELNHLQQLLQVGLGMMTTLRVNVLHPVLVVARTFSKSSGRGIARRAAVGPSLIAHIQNTTVNRYVILTVGVTVLSIKRQQRVKNAAHTQALLKKHALQTAQASMWKVHRHEHWQSQLEH